MTAEIDARNDGLQTSYIITSRNLADLEEAIAGIEKRYHPMGYGTTFDPPRQFSDGSWSCHGRRANSCD